MTVLRDGRIVAPRNARDIDVDWIIEQMVGRSPASLFTRTEHPLGDVLLSVEDVTLPRLGGGFLLDHVSFEVHAGEILGLLRPDGRGPHGAAGGARGRPAGGDRRGLAQRVSDWAPRASPQRIETGIVLVPEDRKTDALVPTLSVAHNMVLASLKRYLRGSGCRAPRSAPRSRA